MEERVRRREKRYWRFVRLEKTSFPKTRSPLELKFLKMKKVKMNDNHQKRRNKTKMRQVTNREVKTDPVVDPKP